APLSPRLGRFDYGPGAPCRGIIRGNDCQVAQPPGNLSHRDAFGPIPITAASEHRNNSPASARNLASGCQHIQKGVVSVSIVDDDPETPSSAGCGNDLLKSPGHNPALPLLSIPAQIPAPGRPL